MRCGGSGDGRDPAVRRGRHRQRSHARERSRLIVVAERSPDLHPSLCYRGAVEPISSTDGDIVRHALAAAAPSGLVAAWIFGSVAAGRAHRESDVDVGVLLDRRVHPNATIRFEVRIHVTNEISAALRDRRLVDVVVLNDISPLLARRIVREGLRVYCVDAAAEHAFRRDVQLQAADLAVFAERNRRIALQALAR